MRSGFAESSSIGFASESLASDGVDGVRFVFSVDEAGAVVCIVDFGGRYAVDFG